MIALRFLALFAIVYLLQGCATEPVDMVLRPSPEFQPVYPLAADRQKVATGGIYSNRQSDAWFGRGRNFQVGDVITVLLNESTQAARTQSSDVSRTSENDVAPAGMTNKMNALGGLLNGSFRLYSTAGRSEGAVGNWQGFTKPSQSSLQIGSG